MDCFTCDAYLLTIVFGHVTRQISWPQRCPLMRFTVFRNYPGWKRPAWTGKSWRFEAIKFLIIFRNVQKTLRSVSVAKETAIAVNFFLENIRRSKSAKLFRELKIREEDEGGQLGVKAKEGVAEDKEGKLLRFMLNCGISIKQN